MYKKLLVIKKIIIFVKIYEKVSTSTKIAHRNPVKIFIK